MNLNQARYRAVSARAIQQVRADRNPNILNRQQPRQRWGTVYTGILGVVGSNQGRDGATGRTELSTPDGSRVSAVAIGRGGLPIGTPTTTVLDGSGGWALY